MRLRRGAAVSSSFWLGLGALYFIVPLFATFKVDFLMIGNIAFGVGIRHYRLRSHLVEFLQRHLA